MKKICLFVGIIFCTMSTAQVKVWNQTRSTDFSSGTSDCIVSTTVLDGELELTHPLVHIGADTLNASLPQFVSCDDAGNSLQGWITAKRVYVQKFNALQQPISGVITVNDSALANDWQIGLALLNDGSFVVTWIEADGITKASRYCQFFDTSNAKVGSNRLTVNLSNIYVPLPVPIADRNNHRYLVVSREGNPTDGFHSYGWMFSAAGVRLGDSIRLVPSGGPRSEIDIQGTCHDGKYAFLISTTEANSSLYDLYFMLADFNAKPVMSPVRVNDDASQGIFPYASFDEAGNCLVVWSRFADTYPGPPGRIFGQAFDTSGRKISGIVQLTHFQSGHVYRKNISWANGQFRIVYEMAGAGNVTLPRLGSYWKILPITFGNFISGVFDAGSPQTTFERISWNGMTPPATRLRFQLRSSVAKEGLQTTQWGGPSSASDFYTHQSGETINAPANHGRFFQWKAVFETDAVGMTPVLNDVSISYVSVDTARPAAVANLTARGEHRRIVLEWGKSPAADTKTYRIYRATGAGLFNVNSFIPLPAQTTVYIDSTVAYDTTYRYAVTVVDSTFNESAMAEAGPVAPTIMKIFVSPSGSGSGDGTMVKPFSTITAACAYSFRGDTVYVLPGDYTEGIMMMKAGTALIGSGAAATRVTAITDGAAVRTAPFTTVKGFSFFVAAGISARGDNVTITENILYHQGTASDEGITSDSSYDNIVISKNILLNFPTAFNVFERTGHALPPPTPVLIRNNIVYGTVGARSTFVNVRYVNNTFVIKGMGDIGGSGMGITFTFGSVVIRNTCIAGIPASGVVPVGVRQGLNVGTLQQNYCNLWKTADAQAGTSASGNIAVDPVFVNAAKYNFHLVRGSQCIDAGNPSTDENDRDSSRNDIGAYGGPDPLPDDMTLAPATNVTVGGGTGFPGDTISVAVVLSNATGLKKADFEIRYDPLVATFIDAARASLTDDHFAVTLQGTHNGSRFVHVEGDSEIVSGGGPIAALRFRLAPIENGERQSAVELTGAEFLDGECNPIAISSIASGVIVVKSPDVLPHRVCVDGGYSGFSDGTLFHPYVNIQQGIDSAKAGDTVMVAAGTYRGPITMKSDVFVKGAGAAVTTILCADDPLCYTSTVVRFNRVRRTGISGCSLINEAKLGESVIEVTSSDAEIAMNKIDQSGAGSASVLVTSGLNVTVRDNYFIESKNGGFFVISIGADTAIISRNTFSPSSAQEVVFVNANIRATIINNVFHLSRRPMMGIVGSKLKRSVIANNLFVGGPSAGTAITLADAESTDVVNNIFDALGTGIDATGGGPNISNNIFTGSTVGVNSPSATTHRYNCYWNNSTNLTSGPASTTELTADPRFVAREKGNYHLARLSPLWNAGDPASLWKDTDGTRNDIGIYGGPYADTSMYAASNIRLRMGSAPGVPGDTVTIPVIASGFVGISGMQLVVEFDSQRLKLLGVHTAVSTRSFSMVQKTIGQSMVSVVLNGSASVAIDSARVVEITMLVQPQATGSAFVKIQNASVISGAAEMISVQHTEDGVIDLTTLSVEGNPDPIPRTYSLEQNFPNPFNPATTIMYQIPAASWVTIKVYNVLGQELATLVDGEQKAGRHRSRWDAGRFASGMYIYRIIAKNFVHSKKMLYLR